MNGYLEEREPVNVSADIGESILYSMFGDVPQHSPNPPDIPRIGQLNSRPVSVCFEVLGRECPNLRELGLPEVRLGLL